MTRMRIIWGGLTDSRRRMATSVPLKPPPTIATVLLVML